MGCKMSHERTGKGVPAIEVESASPRVVGGHVELPKSPDMEPPLPPSHSSGRSSPRSDEEKERFPIHAAVDSSNIGALRQTLTRRSTAVSDLDEKDAEGHTPLFIAAAQNNRAAIVELVKAGAGIEVACGDEQRTPLHIAVIEGHSGAVESLLSLGANAVALTGDEETPLALAVFNGDTTTVKTLISHARPSLDVELGAPYAGTPLFIAAMNNRTEIVRLLIASGASVAVSDAEGWTPLHFAAMDGNEALVKALLKAKCPLNAHNHDGFPPIHYASLNNRGQTVLCLLAAGAYVNYDPKDSFTPLMVATKNGRVDLVRPLLDSEADPLVRSFEGFTALEYAVSGIHTLIAAYLRNAEAKANRQIL